MATLLTGFISFAIALTSVSADASSYQQNAECACDQLMRYYQTSNSGLWGDNDWWQSAIFMTALADLSALDSGYNATYFDTYATTYTNAPGYGDYTGFIDSFDDDEGWWGVAWLTVYDLTQNPDYLNLAISIYDDITQHKSSCGGIIWEKGGTYLASIASELYITLAAGIANRVSSDQKSTYLDSAVSVWDWFFSIGVVGDDWVVVDGANATTCQVSSTAVYSYNQGVILSAAVELAAATGNTTYLGMAGNIANATTALNSQFTGSNGVITDCASGCDNTSAMFKGPLFRGLRQLQLADPHDNWVTWLTTNAQAAWNNDLNLTTVNGETECNLGQYFNGPVSSVSAVTQGAGLDSLIAAWAVTM